MALVLLAALAGLAAGAAPPARFTPQQTRLWAQRNRLLQRANALFLDGKTDEAISLTRKALALERGILGGLSSDGLDWLEGLARLQEHGEHFEDTIATRQEVLTLRRQRYGADDWRVVDARLDLEDARLLARLSLAQRRRLHQATAWNTQVFRLWQQGKSKKALPLARKALSERREILGEKHRLTAQTWFNLGAQYAALSRIPEALRCYRTALAIRKEMQGEKNPDYANSLDNLASLYQDMGDYKAALPLYRQALAIRKDALGEKHPSYGASLNNLALLYKTICDHKAALPLYKQALANTREAHGEKHPHYATSLNNLASLYNAMGDYRQALPLYQQALKVRKEVQGEKHPEYATSLNNLALLYRNMGEHRLALPLYQQALKVRKEVQGEKHPRYAIALNNLAEFYRSMGEHRLALPLYQQALEVYKEALGEKHPEYAQSLNNLAALYGSMGEYRQALPLYQQALEVAREVQGEKHPHYAARLNNLASLYLARGEHRLALPLFQQALEVHKEALGEKHPHYATSLHNLAILYLARKKEGASLVLAGQSLAVTQAHLRDSLSVLSDRERQQLLGQQASRLEVFLSGAIGLVPARILYEQVGGFKDVTSTSIAEQHLARQQPAYRGLLADLRDVRTRLARLGEQLPPARNLERWRQRFDELDRRKTELEQQLGRVSTDFAQLREKPTAARVATRLPERTALVEFLSYSHALRPDGRGGWLQEGRLVAFIVRADRETVLVELGNADRIFSAVRLWRRSATAPRSGGPDSDAARLLRRRLWQPIAKHLDGIDTVLIAPDGDLAALPFAALPGDKPGSYLLEQYTFGYLSSGRQLLLPSLALESSSLLVLGGADFGSSHDKTEPFQLPRNWDALPGAAHEAQQVKLAFRARFADSPVRELTARRATRERFLAALTPGKDKPRWRYLHLATHGHFDAPRYALPPAILGAWSAGAGAAPGLAGATGGLLASLAAQEPGVLNQERGLDLSGRRYRIDEGNPMLLCRLVLAGVNDKGEEGYLSAEEIALLDLSGCELAVLSACETSAGRQAGWQGIQGLQRGFHQAGARHVLASLWSISDPATSVLMEEFYRLLWAKKLSPLQALRQAQLFVLRNPGKVEDRARQLWKQLQGKQATKAGLAKRGIGDAAEGIERPGGAAQSPVAWWAPWLLSGAPAR
jgi:CHAT domain-containing protein/tetratricopeptide (TPR) repeat protein